MSKQTIITPEILKSNGWDIREGVESVITLAEKKIPNTNPINSSEDSEIKLVLHRDFGQIQFAIQLPCGGRVNFNVESMEQLNEFEKMIDFYNPNF